MSVNLNVSAMKYKDPSTGEYKNVVGALGDSYAEDMIAPKYEDLTFPVTEGQLCIYNNSLYKAKQDISTSESWTEAHWETTTIDEGFREANEGLTDLKSQIEEISQTGIDASGASDGQVPVADGQGSWAWDDSAGGVSDVQVNGVSVVTDGVANVPQAKSFGSAGVVKVNNYRGLGFESDGSLCASPANDGHIKGGVTGYAPIVPVTQHMSAFYGLAKAAGDATQSQSSNAVGNYTVNAKSAISQMLNGSVAVTGTTPTITALPGIRYVCGEVATLDITLPASGIVDIVFESGSTPTVLTITPPTGVTVKWANGFDPTALEANTTYEINIADGLGVAGSWT